MHTRDTNNKRSVSKRNIDNNKVDIGKKIFLLMFLIPIMLFSSICYADDNMIVKNLTVEDQPYDGGEGLILKFEPLSKEKRIIEYRIYRGISKEQLFFINSIDVNPNTGVSGNEVTFFDKDFRPFVDLGSPRKLRLEKGQHSGSPIYRALPRDVSIVGPLLDEFSILAIIDKNNFFKKSTKHVVEEGDREVLYGGLRIEDFETILANVLPGKKYFYTVIAVDERRNFHPYAPIVYGIASDNMPMPSEKMNVRWIEDTHMLNIEYELPMYTDDVAQHTVYMIRTADMEALQQFKSYMLELDDWNKKASEGDTLIVKPDAVANPGRLLAVNQATSLNFLRVSYEDGFLINEFDASKVEFDIDNIADYLFYVSMDDYSGFEATSEPVMAMKIDSTMLPTLPHFEVRDKPYDKGDANEIIIGRPLAHLTSVDFRGREGDKTKLSFAYSFSPNPKTKIRSITFDFVDNAENPIGSKTEYYFSNVFNITLPSEKYFDDGFKVYISFDVQKNSPHYDTITQSGAYLSQYISFDEDLMMLKPGNLYIDGEEIINLRYQILKKSLSDKHFRMAARLTPMMNLFDDYVAYERYIYKGLSSYDLEKNHLLFDTSIDVGFDSNLDTPVLTNIFYNDFIRIAKQQIEDYHQILTDDPENLEAAWYIENLSQRLDTQTEHPYLREINQISSQRARIKSLVKLRETNKRTFQYILVKTDGEALFSVSDIFVNESGESYFTPISNWFSKSSVPMLIATLIFAFFVFYCYWVTRIGKDMFIRPIAGIEEIDNAIGRATEMGRPILFVPGLSSIEDVATLAGLSILGHIAKKAVQYDTKIIVPNTDYIVLPIAQQIVKEAHYVAGRPDSYDANDVFFVAAEQFAYVAGVNGIMIRQKTATNFYMGYFFAEALIMTETGNMTGAIQVAGTDAVTQIPFFITTCDYTLIGEELYAASAYLSRDPMILGTLKSQDYTKLIIILCIFIGTILSTLNMTGMIKWFPAE